MRTLLMVFIVSLTAQHNATATTQYNMDDTTATGATNTVQNVEYTTSNSQTALSLKTSELPNNYDLTSSRTTTVSEASTNIITGVQIDGTTADDTTLTSVDTTAVPITTTTTSTSTSSTSATTTTLAVVQTIPMVTAPEPTIADNVITTAAATTTASEGVTSSTTNSTTADDTTLTAVDTTAVPVTTTTTSPSSSSTSATTTTLAVYNPTTAIQNIQIETTAATTTVSEGGILSTTGLSNTVAGVQTDGTSATLTSVDTTTGTITTTTMSPSSSSTSATTTTLAESNPTTAVQRITTTIAAGSVFPTTTINRTVTTATFRLTSSSPVIRPCDRNICWNGGTCTFNVVTNATTCLCSPGFIDYDCAVDIDDCASYPCDPFGDCVDGINGYTCDCKAGFLPTNSTRFCSEIDECHPSTDGQSPCLNNATCQDEVGRFRCLCPKRPGGDSVLVGLRCESYSDPKVFPVVRSMQPTRGMIAGGARITIIGDRMDLYPALGANFSDNQGNIVYGFAVTNYSSPNAIVVTAPRVNESFIGKQLTVKVEFSGPVEQNVVLHFTYIDNPNITDIQPRLQLMTGGIQLTVLGNALDAVSDPTMVTTWRIHNPNTNYEDIRSDATACQHDKSDNMLCRMPVLNLPDELIGSNDTRRDGNAVATIRNGNTTANLYIGFVLEGLPTYRNISKSNPRISFTLVSISAKFEPRSSADPVSFNPDVDKLLDIKGEKFTYGCSQNDYLITLGTGNCSVAGFTDNFITCSPPTERPQVIASSFCSNTSDLFALKVQIGLDEKNTFFVYCVRWKSDDQPDVALIVGLCVGLGAGFILILIVIISVIIHRRRPSTGRQPPNVDKLDADSRMLVDRIKLSYASPGAGSALVRRNSQSSAGHVLDNGPTGEFRGHGRGLTGSDANPTIWTSVTPTGHDVLHQDANTATGYLRPVSYIELLPDYDNLPIDADTATSSVDNVAVSANVATGYLRPVSYIEPLPDYDSNLPTATDTVTSSPRYVNSRMFSWRPTYDQWGPVGSKDGRR